MDSGWRGTKYGLGPSGLWGGIGQCREGPLPRLNESPEPPSGMDGYRYLHCDSVPLVSGLPQSCQSQTVACAKHGKSGLCGPYTGCLSC